MNCKSQPSPACHALSRAQCGFSQNDGAGLKIASQSYLSRGPDAQVGHRWDPKGRESYDNIIWREEKEIPSFFRAARMMGLGVGTWNAVPTGKDRDPYFNPYSQTLRSLGPTPGKQASFLGILSSGRGGGCRCHHQSHLPGPTFLHASTFGDN